MVHDAKEKQNTKMEKPLHSFLKKNKKQTAVCNLGLNYFQKTNIIATYKPFSLELLFLLSANIT